tara:strand:- start:616 stop:1137 length:522 start_codon:yes stop_codon:yes gene_type:complete
MLALLHLPLASHFAHLVALCVSAHAVGGDGGGMGGNGAAGGGELGSGGSGGDGTAGGGELISQTPHVSSHLAAIVALVHLDCFASHQVCPLASSQGGGGEGCGSGALGGDVGGGGDGNGLGGDVGGGGADGESGGSDGDGGTGGAPTKTHSPHVSSHLAAILLLVHLLTFAAQ